MTGQILWLDGHFESPTSAKCSLLSHSLHYGSAIFDGLRFYASCYGPAAFRLKEHIERFFHSAEAIGFCLPFSQEEIFTAVLELVRVNQLQSGYIRLIGFFGEGDMELHPTQATLHTGIFVWPWAPRMGTSCIRVKTSSFVRTPPLTTIITAKLAGHYANSILARQEARREGYHEALFLDINGNIAEGAGANFFMMKEDVLFTPPKDYVFPGITRDTVLQIAEHLRIPYRIDNIQPRELSSCDESFFTGTAMEIISIESIDTTPMKKAIGPIALLLKTHYAEIVHGKNSHFHHWLTFISEKIQ